MRILFVGSLAEGSTTWDRVRALDALGQEVVPFDTARYIGTVTPLEQSLMGRANFGRGIAMLNRDLVELAETISYDMFWVDKGVWIYPEVVSELKTRSRRKLAVHSTPDAQLLENRSRHFIKAIPLYDLLVTTKPFELKSYEQSGGKEVLMILQGYGHRFADSRQCGSVPVHLTSDVCFVGHSQAHYRRTIKVVASTEAIVKIWGPRWPRHARIHRWLRPMVHGDGLWGEDYPRALRASKIALGLLSKRIPETTTTRTFEIPATGTFMLAERTADHLALFEEGKEAEFFSGDEELRDKVRFYLADDVSRQKIARAGRERSVRSGYDVTNQMRRILERVDGCYGASARRPPSRCGHPILTREQA